MGVVSEQTFRAYNMKFSLQIMLAIICMSAFIQLSVASAYYDLQYIPDWFRTSEPHPEVEPEPHYEEPAPHYEEPEYHYEKPTPHYDEPEPHYDEPEPYPLDPHGKDKQCVDVSTYTFPKWVKKRQEMLYNSF